MKALRLVWALVLICGFFAVAAGGAAAAPGDLDRFFGREGVVTLESLPDGNYDAAVDMAVGPSDRIYVLRRQERCGEPFGCETRLLVTRHHAHGSRDDSFGVGGISNVFAFPTGELSAQGSLEVDSTGRAVVGTAAGGRLVLARFAPDGRLDTSFGGDGVIEYDLGIAAAEVQIALRDDGAIAVAAEARPAPPTYTEEAVVVARYTQQGAADPAFHNGTPVVTNLGSGLGGLGLTKKSGVVIAGRRAGCCDVAGSSVHVVRLDASGAFDAQFGNRGHRFVDDVMSNAKVGAVVVLPSGKIVVAGNGGRVGDAFALRLLSGGRLDRTFGNRGVAYMKGSKVDVVGAELGGRGKIVIGGTSHVVRYPERGHLTVLRRQANGRPDRTFGGGGPVRLGSVGDTEAISIGVQSGGRIVALVASGSCARICPPPKWMFVRYLGGSDSARCNGQKATVVGTRAGEKLDGTPRRDVIAALGGDDLVRGHGGNDLVCGGRGNDTLVGGQGKKDRLSGGPGRDQLRQQ